MKPPPDGVGESIRRRARRQWTKILGWIEWDEINTLDWVMGTEAYLLNGPTLLLPIASANKTYGLG